MTIRKGAFLLLLLWGIPVLAQEKTEYDRIQKKTSIIQGTASISRVELFDDEWNLDFDLQYIRMISNPLGLGIKTSGYVTFLDGDNASGIAAGPVLRANLYQQNTYFIYVEGFHQLRYFDQLQDRLFDNNSVWNRTGLSLGASVRLSNRAGVFLRVEQIWERDFEDAFFGSDTRIRTLSIGLELFSF